MNRFLVGLVCLAVVGCSPEEGGSSAGSSAPSLADLNVQLKMPSFEITDDNGSSIAQAGLGSVESADVDLPDRSLPIQNRQLRTTSTLDCNPGTWSSTVTSNDIDASTSEFNISGSHKTVDLFDNCTVFVMELNGQITADLYWTGYSAATNDFDSTSFAVTFVNYSTSYSLTGETSVDGAFSGVVIGTTTTTDWALSVSSSATNGEILTSETTTSVVKNDDDNYLSAGTWIINGANDTSVLTTVVANGLEISINGGQATLVEWSDLDDF